MTRFGRIELRTTDVPAARLFYRALLGDDDADIVPLPAEAIARGARPHWLGHLGVGRRGRNGARLRSRTVQPAWDRPGRRPLAAGWRSLRDPGGAVVALATPTTATARPEVVLALLEHG